MESYIGVESIVPREGDVRVQTYVGDVGSPNYSSKKQCQLDW